MTGKATVALVITWLDTGGATATVEALARGLSDRFDVVVVAGSGEPATVSRRTRLEDAGVRVVVLDSLRREIHPWRDAVAYRELRSVLSGIEPQVVHTHSSKAGILGRLVATRLGVPAIVHTVHGWSRGGGSRALQLAERVAAHWCDRLVVVTEKDREVGLAQQVGRDDQYVVIRSGIDLSAFRPNPVARSATRARWRVGDSTVVIGTVGRLSEQKDPRTLVRAFQEFHERRPDSRLVVVGEGPLQAEIEAQIRDAGIQDVVILEGTRNDIPELLPGFDLFTLTSRWEGLPRAAVEAMAVRLPVVSTAVSGLAELVVDDVTGLTAPVADHDAFARAWERLAADPHAVRRFAATAGETVREFSGEQMLADTVGCYEDLLAHGSGATAQQWSRERRIE